MRLGIFGGTFDPIHLAHLRCAEEAREALALDRVLFVPAAVPPHKGGTLAAPAHRLAMVRAAIRGHPAFHVSAIEIARQGRSYSVDTLRLLRARLPASTRFVFLIGADAFREIATWKQYRALFALTDFAVMTRPPLTRVALRALLPVAARREFCYAPDRQTLLHRTGTRIRSLHVTALDLSASAIRLRVRRGQSIRYLVPSAVERYIARHRLYQRGSRTS
jgi:nicotinate-nucleotide adenylyltransferase